eukprot:1887308-Alexandrium_andersonii.AAC.1
MSAICQTHSAASRCSLGDLPFAGRPFNAGGTGATGPGGLAPKARSVPHQVVLSGLLALHLTMGE